eukprot:COSAG02_NODE_4722_length_5052_cov_9.256612_1_plen_97_part_00
MARLAESGQSGHSCAVSEYLGTRTPRFEPWPVGEMVNFGVWGPIATPHALATRRPLIPEVSRGARGKTVGEGRNITVARPTKLQHVPRETFEVVAN